MGISDHDLTRSKEQAWDKTHNSSNYKSAVLLTQTGSNWLKDFMQGKNKGNLEKLTQMKLSSGRAVKFHLYGPIGISYLQYALQWLAHAQPCGK